MTGLTEPLRMRTILVRCCAQALARSLRSPPPTSSTAANVLHYSKDKRLTKHAHTHNACVVRDTIHTMNMYLAIPSLLSYLMLPNEGVQSSMKIRTSPYTGNIAKGLLHRSRTLRAVWRLRWWPGFARNAVLAVVR